MSDLFAGEIEQLAAQLKAYNKAYRDGQPLIEDPEYDRLVERLRELAPDHPFLNQVEPESFPARREVRHPQPMLSIEKAYTPDDLDRFVNRVIKEAAEIGIVDIRFIVTPKLDGLAGRDDGDVFASRGNGMVGYDIGSAFEKGVIPLDGRGRGIGEIVIQKSYFDTHLAEKFEHPRNLVVGIVNADTLNEDAVRAIEAGAVLFVPYSSLDFWIGTPDELLNGIAEVTEELASKTDFPMDGMVAGVLDERVREHMGATAHHYRWQIAIKTKGETAVTRVEEVVWQVGRTGNVTPVMAVAPVSLSGATIRRVTAHNAGKVRQEGIGPGAEIEIIRSGEVIPKLEQVITPSRKVDLPEVCPACQTPLIWENDFLKCPASDCPAQTIQGLIHFFKILGSAEWFGVKTIEKLVAGGYDSLEKIYALTEADYLELGFGPVQSKNLAAAIQTSLSKVVEDWRFLAAFGIPNLGTGDSRRLLSHIRLEELAAIQEAELKAIHGFGEITSRSIVTGIREKWPLIEYMLHLEFVLSRTQLETEKKEVTSAIAGRRIVFTGKMKQGSRQAMQAQARSLGAIVQTAVSGKTDLLVCGENVGEAKLAKARNGNVTILSEAEYYQLIADET